MYNYVDDGLLKIKNYDLPEKLVRNTNAHHVCKNKKKLGRSIEERPEEIDYREVFGHWECDLVLGHKTKDDKVGMKYSRPLLLTMALNLQIYLTWKKHPISWSIMLIHILHAPKAELKDTIV